MQTDKDLFDLIKEAYPLNPREEFVSSTSDKLKQTARKIYRKKKIKQFSFASTSIAICAIAFSWFFFYGGKDVISNNYNTLQERNSASSTTVNNQDPLVYIYQSHNLESFFTESKTNDPNEAFHDTNNITLVGKRLSQSLKKRGINSIHDNTNIMAILKEKNLPFSESYKVSREPLEEALANNKTIKIVLDIHRDSRKRSDTTINLDGIDYPRIAFIVSSSSVNYEENLKFTELLHNKIEEKYPHLSRGVFVKDNPPKQNTYNQDLFGNSVLLEIGGPENTLDEEYRTVDVLSEIINEILLDTNENNENLEEITIYDLVNGSEKLVLTDKEAIEIIKDAIKGANKQPGVVDMAEPQYKINLGDEIYFLWIARSGGTIGTIMNFEDTDTIYTLSERSTTQLKEMLLEFKLR